MWRKKSWVWDYIFIFAGTALMSIALNSAAKSGTAGKNIISNQAGGSCGFDRRRTQTPDYTGAAV